MKPQAGETIFRLQSIYRVANKLKTKMIVFLKKEGMYSYVYVFIHMLKHLDERIGE